MHPLPAHTVSLVLQLISPLTDPLPPHILSTPLRQRHHFLQIAPSSPVEYLCWPSPDNVSIINLLNRLPPLSDHATFPTRYTSDLEYTIAHVQISSDPQGLRMLFHWDDIHGWKYHDLRLMPFPSPSYSTPQEYLASSSACSAADPSRPSSPGDDTYWNAYGATGHDLTSPPSPQIATDDAEGEDTYWAQYASVQGSADSTVPSPLPIHRKLRLENSAHDELASLFPSQNDPIIDIPVDAIHSRHLASRPDPPSPNMLAHLLSIVSPREEIHSPVLDDPSSSQSPSVLNTNPLPKQSMTDSESVIPPLPNGHLNVSPVTFKLNGSLLSKCYSHPHTEDTALAESIRGLYYLWRAGRKGGSDEKDQSTFLRIVQAAIVYE